MIKEAGAYLKANFNQSQLKEIKFFDFGGGSSISFLKDDAALYQIGSKGSPKNSGKIR